MNAYRLHKPDGTPTDVWVCSTCGEKSGRIEVDDEYGGVFKSLAERCCTAEEEAEFKGRMESLAVHYADTGEIVSVTEHLERRSESTESQPLGLASDTFASGTDWRGNV